MKILVVGAGGREHALVRALARSPQRPELLCAPGNAGIAKDARMVDVAADDVEALVSAVEREQVDLTVVGPEAPLVAGLVDALAARGHAAFGPTKAAAQLEGSKAFAKQAMVQAGVPTARWRKVASLQEGLDAVAALAGAAEGTALAGAADEGAAEGTALAGAADEGAAEGACLAASGVVVKADGLAAGKGVTVAEDAAQARAALEEIFVAGRFGEEGASAVVEERLVGEELSLLALCDGVRAVPMAPARDYKRIYDGDSGPNTGGMGSYSPVAGFDAEAVKAIVSEVHQPVVDLMRERGTPFHGVLYAGLMMTAEGPKVLEFNVRFGDPETQAVLPRLRSDLVGALLAATKPGGLEGVELSWSEEWAVTLVLASAGYPASSSSGDVIHGLADVADPIEVTHAGTALRDGEIVTAGGRVLNVTALGPDARSARATAYAAAQRIVFEGKQWRSDIAAQAEVEQAIG